jgi:hypothetical protein
MARLSAAVLRAVSAAAASAAAMRAARAAAKRPAFASTGRMAATMKAVAAKVHIAWRNRTRKIEGITVLLKRSCCENRMDTVTLQAVLPEKMAYPSALA